MTYTKNQKELLESTLEIIENLVAWRGTRQDAINSVKRNFNKQVKSKGHVSIILSDDTEKDYEIQDLKAIWKKIQ